MRTRLQFLYVFESRTPNGYKYHAYGNSLDNPPMGWTGIAYVNLNKYGRK